MWPFGKKKKPLSFEEFQAQKSSGTVPAPETSQGGVLSFEQFKAQKQPVKNTQVLGFDDFKNGSNAIGFDEFVKPAKTPVAQPKPVDQIEHDQKPSFGDRVLGTGLSVVKGTIGATKSIPDVLRFGSNLASGGKYEQTKLGQANRWASQQMQEALDIAQSIKPESIQELEANQVISRDESGKWQINAPNPTQAINVIAESLPQIPGYLVGGKWIGAAGAGLMRVPGAAKLLSKIPGAEKAVATISKYAEPAQQGAVNAPIIASQTFSSTYDEVFQQAKSQGMSDEEAQKIATEQALQAGKEIAPVSAVTGAGLGFAQRSTGGLITRTGKGIIKEGVSEAPEETWQQSAQNRAAKRLDPSREIVSPEALNAGAMGFIAGGATGGVVAATNKVEIPNGYNPKKNVEKFFEVINSGEQEKVQATTAKMSTKELQETERILESIREKSYGEPLSSETMIKLADYSEQITDLIQEKQTNIETEAKRIYSGQPKTEKSPELHISDQAAVKTIIDKVSEALSPEKQSEIKNQLDEEIDIATLPGVKETKALLNENNPFIEANSIEEIAEKYEQEKSKTSKQLSLFDAEKSDLLAQKSSTQDKTEKKNIQDLIDEIDLKRREVQANESILSEQAAAKEISLVQDSVDKIREIEPNFDVVGSVEKGWSRDDYDTYLKGISDNNEEKPETPFAKLEETEAKVTRDKLVEDDIISSAKKTETIKIEQKVKKPAEKNLPQKPTEKPTEVKNEPAQIVVPDTPVETAMKSKEDAYSKMKRLMKEGYEEDEDGELWTSDNIDKYSDEASEALQKIGFKLEFNDSFDSYEILLNNSDIDIKEAQKMFVDLAMAWDFELETNQDGTISMFHGTNKENAKSILKDGFEEGTFFSPSTEKEFGGVNGASYYGDSILKADIDPRELVFRTEGEFYTNEESAISNVRDESGIEKKSTVVSESFVDINSEKKVETPVAKEAPKTASTGMRIEDHATFMKDLREGNQTPESLKETFESIIANSREIAAELQKKTKNELKTLIGGIQAYYVDRENKEYAVKSAYSSMLFDFALGKTVTYGGFDGQVNAIREMVDKTTEADIKDYAERVKQARAERAARVEANAKAVTNPETMDEFRTFIELKGKDALKGALLERYDTLVGENAAARIQKEKEEKAIVKGVDVDTNAEIVETKHTKTGEQLFVVKLADRVEKDVYSSILGSAKKLGGWYSSYRVGGAIPGFQFKTKEAADQFVAVLGGETVVSERSEERQGEKKENQVDRLRAAAETVRAKALESLGRERKTNTQRRAGMANSAEETARKQLQQAESLENIAGAIERGEAKLLGLLSTRTQVEALDQAINEAKWTYGRAHDIRSEKWDEIDMGDAISEITTFPARIYNMKRLIEAGKVTKGYKRVAAAMEKESKNGELSPSFTRAQEIAALAKEADIDTWWSDQFKRIASLGVRTPAEYRSVLREYAKYKGVKPEEDKATALERKLIGAKVGIDFFPTPKSVSEQMVAEAGIEEGMRVLEPSAGNGNIAEAIRGAGVKPDVAEISSELRDILDAKGFNIVGQDFMEINEPYDRIVMNPPFSNNMDIKHVEKAYSLLAPGGRLVSIVGEGAFFRSGKTETAFRNWLDSVGAKVEKLPEGTFTDTSLLATTGTNARIVIINKQDEDVVLNDIPFFAGRTTEKQNIPGERRFERKSEGMKQVFFSLIGDGTINYEDYKKLEFVIDSFKGNIDDIALHLGETQGKEGAGGEYNPYTKIISLYDRVSDGYNAESIMETFFHEIMHPGERYLSKKTVAKLRKHFTDVQNEAFGRFPGLKEAVKNKDLSYFSKEIHGEYPHEKLYRFYSLSEYIAETGKEKTWRMLDEQKIDSEIMATEKSVRPEINRIMQAIAQLWRNFLRFMRRFKNIDERLFTELMSGNSVKNRETADWELKDASASLDDQELLILRVLYGTKMPQGKRAWVESVLNENMTEKDIFKAIDMLVRFGIKPYEFNKAGSLNSVSAKRFGVDSSTLITPSKRDRYKNIIEQMGGIVAAEISLSEELSSMPKYYDDMEYQYNSFTELFRKFPSYRETLTSSDISGIKSKLDEKYGSKLGDIFYSDTMTDDEVLDDFRDTLSKENPDLYYGKKEAASLGYSKERSKFKQAMKNLESGSSAYSTEYKSLRSELDEIQEESAGYRSVLAKQLAEGKFTYLGKNLKELGLVMPKKGMFSKQIVEKRLEKTRKSSFTSGVKKGFNIGAKTGMAYMREIAENKALSVAAKKKQIVEYAREAKLPESRRGGILSMVLNAKTEKDVLKAIGRIDRAAEYYRSKEIISEIKKVVSRVMKTETIDIGYKERISAVIDGFNLSNRRRSTIDRLSATKQYIARQKSEGKDVDIPKRVQKAIEDLDKTLISSMSEADLITLLSEISYLEEIGKNKLKTRRAVYEMKRDRIKRELVENTVRMDMSPVFESLPGDKQLSLKEKLKNFVPKTVNFFSKVDKYISPVDVIFDVLDGSKGFVGSNYRLFKRNLDVKFGKFLDRKDIYQVPVKDYVDKHKMTVQQFERVGIHAARVQEGGMDKLSNLGLTEEYIDEIELTDVEMGLYDLMRKNLDDLRPEIEQVMRTVYNKPLEKVDNYFSFMTDFDKVSDVEVLERIVNAKELGPGKTKTVKKGFTLSRTGSGGQKIKVNAMEIYLKHTENASYLVEMAESIQMLSEVANSNEYLESSGEFGAQMVREWLDTMARKGGLLGEQQIEWLDKMRVNLGAAVLGFKLTAALIQPTALFNGASIIGNYAFKGANNITDQRWRTFLKQFPELRDRMADDPSYLESGFKSLEKVQRYGYMPLQKLDSITASAIVSGAYQKYMDEHGKTVSLDGAPDPDGINYAEMVLRRTQSSAFFKDIPLVLTRGKVGGRSVTKALLQFQNFLLNAWSLLRHEGIRRGIGQKRFTEAYRIFMWTGMSIFAATAIREGIKQALSVISEKDDDEEDEEYWFAKKYLKEMLGYVPFVSQGMSVYSYGSFPVPSLSIFGDVDLAAGQIQGKKTDTQLRGWIRAGAIFGKLFGIPGTVQTQQILNDLTYE